MSRHTVEAAASAGCPPERWAGEGGQAGTPAQGPTPPTLSGVIRMTNPGALERRRREDCVGSQVDVREVLKQRTGSALQHAGTAVDNQVLAQAPLVERRGLDGEDHPRVALDIANLQSVLHVRGHDFRPIESDPDTANLGAAVGVEGH